MLYLENIHWSKRHIEILFVEESAEAEFDAGLKNAGHLACIRYQANAMPLV